MKGSFNDIINGDTPVLVDFWADWCGPCHALAPTIKEVASELSGKVKVIKIDVDKNQAVAGQFQIRSIPTMILFDKGKVIWRQSGVLPKEQIMSSINDVVA